MKNKNIQPIIYSILIVIGILLGQKLNSPENYSKLEHVLQLINDSYVDTVHPNFENKAISSILQNLDPHSTYIPKEDFKIEHQKMEGSFSGIGIEFQIISDTIVVIAPISEGPSKKLGIKSGDKIIIVNGENVANIGIKNKGVLKRLRGEKGSNVKVEIKRSGINALLEFVIIRDDIPLHSIDAALMLKATTGYIKINRFSAKTYQEFYTASNKLLNLGMTKLILDLRDNPGGYLNTAVQICDDFFDSGYLIVYTEGGKRKRQNLFSSKKGILKNIKIAALINEGSASASEIIVGALQDNDRGDIIGRKSFGKGLVQEEILLKDGAAIRITTQRYYTPSGRCIQKPYNDNLTEYYLEQYKKDRSTKDSIEFKTLKGDIVYGGGGITPDYIVKQDENLDYSKINYLISKGLITEFSINYTYLFKDLSWEEFEKEKFLNKKNISLAFKKFKNLVNTKEKEFLFDIGTIEEIYLKNLIMASLAKRIWDEDAYYLIIIENDEMITKAKELF